MRLFIEATEVLEDGFSGDKDFHQEEAFSAEQTELSSRLSTINASLDGQKTYEKRVHYCMHEHNQPCVVEEIIEDNITTNKMPEMEISL